jgi:hypothetical protein
MLLTKSARTNALTTSMIARASKPSSGADERSPGHADLALADESLDDRELAMRRPLLHVQR